MYFTKGADMKTVSFLEPGSSLGFSSEDVIINGEKLVKRGSVRFTTKYMVYPSTINSSNGGMDIDVYLSSGNSNFDCIIDWGNNTLEQFKLIEVDLAAYKKSQAEIKKQNELKKSKYLSDLPLKLKNVEEELDKTVDLNKKLDLIYSIVNDYNEYKILFQNDPSEIVKLNLLSKEISSQIDKQKNDLIANDKKMDSLRILNVRVISFSKSDRNIDTFMVVKRATSLVFNTFFKDSSIFLNNYLDSNFIDLFSKKVNVIKILNSTYLDDSTFIQVCELNIPLIDFFKLGENSGWKLPVPNLSNSTIFKVRKLDFLKIQEFNAMCDVIGSIHNLTYGIFESKLKKSALINEGNVWKAKYEIDVIFNDKIKDIRKLMLSNMTHFSLSNIDLCSSFISDPNVEKFSIFISAEIGENTDVVNTNRGKYINFTLTNSMTFDLVNDYFKKLNDFYYKSWSVNIFNNKYYGTQKEIIADWALNQVSSDNPKTWISDHSSLEAEYFAKSTNIKFPQKSQIINSYKVNVALKESEIEKYTDSLILNFENPGRIKYKEGGFKTILYTYGVTVSYEGKKTLNQYTGETYESFVYNNPSNNLLPDQLLPIVKKGYPIFIYVSDEYVRRENLFLIADNKAYFEICNYFGDTITRKFYSPVGGGKKGNKPQIAYAKPTKMTVLYSIFPIFPSNTTENSTLMVSYMTDWNSNYTADNYTLNSIASRFEQVNFYSNYSRNVSYGSGKESPPAAFKIVKIEKQ
jgi:hypothetical protein